MKFVSSLLIGAGVLLVTPHVAFAAENADVTRFTSQAFTVLITFASLAAAFFLVRGGFLYITSTGKPDELNQAKTSIRNALIGLVLVIGAGVFSSVLHTAYTTASQNNAGQSFELKPIEPAEPSSGLTQILIDAVTGFMQNIIESATKPVVEGLIGFLTETPSLLNNSVVFNFWLTVTGIVDSLFLILIALLGFQVMSVSTFGFDELELKHLLPRIGLAFLGANSSIFIIDWIIALCNLLVRVVLDSTNRLDNALILNTINPTMWSTGSGLPSLITVIFMILFIILAITLLIFYIIRLITLSVGAVLSPFIFLLWLLPGFTDFAIISMRSYLVTIFTVFVHVVIIQLASSFLTIPGQVGTNTFFSVIVGVATLFSLMKAPGMLLQFAFYSAAHGAIRKLGGQIVHVVASKKAETRGTANEATKVTRRKSVAL